MSFILPVGVLLNSPELHNIKMVSTSTLTAALSLVVATYHPGIRSGYSVAAATDRNVRRTSPSENRQRTRPSPPTNRPPGEAPKNVKFNRYLGLGQNKLLNMLLNHPVRIIFILSSFLPLCPLNLGYGDQNIYFTSADVSICVKPGVPYSSKNFSHSLGLQNQFIRIEY